jgi:DNA polymerase IV
MKVLCILLPHFPLHCEIVRRPDLQSQPAIVTITAGSQKLVLDYSPELTGLQRDMPLQQALSRHGESTLIAADLPHYRNLFNEILDRMETLSPLVEDYDMGQTYLGLDGLQLIYPDDAALVGEAQKLVPPGFPVQIGIAEGKFLAYLAALHSQPGGYRRITGQPADFLSDLPCDVLPISLKSKNKLHDFGLHRLGQITALADSPVQSQFGAEGRRIKELSVGYDSAPFYPRYTAELIEENRVLSSVTVSLEAILANIESLLARAFSRFSSRGLGIRSLTLWTRGWNAEQWEHSLRFKEPAMDVPGASARVKQMLEGFPQPGPVEQVGLKITGLGHQSGRQKSLFSEVRAQANLLSDIHQLELRMGSHQVFKIKEVEPWSRIPERRYALTSLNP